MMASKIVPCSKQGILKVTCSPANFPSSSVSAMLTGLMNIASFGTGASIATSSKLMGSAKLAGRLHTGRPICLERLAHTGRLADRMGMGMGRGMVVGMAMNEEIGINGSGAPWRPVHTHLIPVASNSPKGSGAAGRPFHTHLTPVASNSPKGNGAAGRFFHTRVLEDSSNRVEELGVRGTACKSFHTGMSAKAGEWDGSAPTARRAAVSGRWFHTGMFRKAAEGDGSAPAVRRMEDPNSRPNETSTSAWGVGEPEVDMEEMQRGEGAGRGGGVRGGHGGVGGKGMKSQVVGEEGGFQPARPSDAAAKPDYQNDDPGGLPRGFADDPEGKGEVAAREAAVGAGGVLSESESPGPGVSAEDPGLEPGGGGASGLQDSQAGHTSNSKEQQEEIAASPDAPEMVGAAPEATEGASETMYPFNVDAPEHDARPHRLMNESLGSIHLDRATTDREAIISQGYSADGGEREEEEEDSGTIGLGAGDLNLDDLHRPQPHLVAPTYGKAVWAMGTKVTVKVPGQQTGGHYSLMEYHVSPGTKCSPHSHSAEDECWYLLEGSMEWTVGSQVFAAERGAYLHLPRDVIHAYKNTGASTAHILVTAMPAGLEDYFLAIGMPARRDLRDRSPPLAAEDMRSAVDVGKKFGISFDATMSTSAYTSD